MDSQSLREVDSCPVSQNVWGAITDAFDSDTHIDFDGHRWFVSSVFLSEGESGLSRVATLRAVTGQ